MTSEEPPAPANNAPAPIAFPQDRRAGTYANGVVSSANQYEIMIDFMVNVDGPGIPASHEIVQRVRFPIAMAGALLQSVGGAMDTYEQNFGKIRKPGE